MGASTEAGTLRRRVLAATCVSYVIVLLDTSIVNVALSSLATAFDTHIAGLQWVVNAYTLMFASLLLTGGTLGDRWGARRVYLAGLLLFTLASVLCAAAQSLPALVLGRVIQGVGAALLVPCSLKLIHHANPDPARRARAIGLWAGLGGVALAMGPLVGGALIQWGGWRGVFLVNIPVCLFGIGMMCRPFGEAPRRPAERVDVQGQACAVVALGASIGVLIEGPVMGWTSPQVIAGAMLALSAWVGWGMIMRRHPHPMLPPSLFQNGIFTGSTCVSMASAFVFYGLLFVMSLHYQQARGYTPLQTGLALFPMMGMVAVGSMSARRLAARYGAKWSMIGAFSAYAAGAIGLHASMAGMAYASSVVPMLAVGMASGVISPMATAPALETVGAHRVGVAAAVLNAARQVGAALGVALFGAIVGTVHPYETGLRSALILVAAVSIAAMWPWCIALKPRHSA